MISLIYYALEVLYARPVVKGYEHIVAESPDPSAYLYFLSESLSREQLADFRAFHLFLFLQKIISFFNVHICGATRCVPHIMQN